MDIGDKLDAELSNANNNDSNEEGNNVETENSETETIESVAPETETETGEDKTEELPDGMVEVDGEVIAREDYTKSFSRWGAVMVMEVIDDGHFRECSPSELNLDEYAVQKELGKQDLKSHIRDLYADDESSFSAEDRPLRLFRAQESGPVSASKASKVRQRIVDKFGEGAADEILEGMDL